MSCMCRKIHALTVTFTSCSEETLVGETQIESKCLQKCLRIVLIGIQTRMSVLLFPLAIYSHPEQMCVKQTSRPRPLILLVLHMSTVCQQHTATFYRPDCSSLQNQASAGFHWRSQLLFFECESRNRYFICCCVGNAGFLRH